MSEEPRRWKGDPAEDPGLASLDALYDGYALPGVPKLPPPGPSGLGWLGGGVGLVLAVLAAWWVWPSAGVVDAPSIAPAELVAPIALEAPAAVEAPIAPAAPLDPAELLAPAAPAGEPPGGPSPAPQERQPTPPEPLVPGGPAADGVVDAAPAETPSAPRPAGTGTLEAELAAYSPAGDALADGDFERALSAYDAYLAAWPGGRFASGARLGRLESLAGLARWSEVEALAATLLASGELSVGKRQAVEGLRARALVLLGRCPEALVLAETLDRADQVEVRRACR